MHAIARNEPAYKWIYMLGGDRGIGRTFEVVRHWATTGRQPPIPTILYISCTGGTECISRTHSICAVRTLLGVNQKTLSIRKEPMLSVFLTLNVQLSWLSGRALVAQVRGVLGLTPGNWRRLFTFLYYRLIASLFPAWGKMLWGGEPASLQTLCITVSTQFALVLTSIVFTTPNFQCWDSERKDLECCYLFQSSLNLKLWEGGGCLHTHLHLVL